MITYEYHAKLLKDGHLSIPPDIKSKLRPKDIKGTVPFTQQTLMSLWLINGDEN